MYSWTFYRTFSATCTEIKLLIPHHTLICSSTYSTIYMVAHNNKKTNQYSLSSFPPHTVQKRETEKLLRDYRCVLCLLCFVISNLKCFNVFKYRLPTEILQKNLLDIITDKQKCSQITDSTHIAINLPFIATFDITQKKYQMRQVL